MAVGLPLDNDFFTYIIPDALSDCVRPGSRVLVPFGTRRITGFVLEVRPRHGDEPELRPIEDVLDAEPVVGAAILDLCRWAASYYLVTPGEMIRSAVPAGLAVEDARWAELTEAGRAAVAAGNAVPRELAARPEGVAVEPLLRSGALKGSVLARLVALGLVVAQRRLERPTAVAMTERHYRLLSSPSLTARQKKAAALVALLAREPGATRERIEREVPNCAQHLARLVAGGSVAFDEVRVFRDPFAGEEIDATPRPELTADQRAVVTAVTSRLEAGFAPYLLHGVTGSGKTEVYLRLIEEILARGKSALVLVPEIALTPQLAARFRGRLGDQVAVLHSGLGDSERYDQWSRLAQGQARVALGARSAIFAPLDRLGLVVVDEEHESSFKQEDRPRYNARDLALVRGSAAGCSVVLGSATPSLESFRNSMTGKYTYLPLPSRVEDRPMPAVTLVDLRRTKVEGEGGLLSVPLVEALRETVAAGEQAILFLNRRGFAPVLLCKSCGNSAECPDCAVSLTVHMRPPGLRCHYCDRREPMRPRCVSCHGTDLQVVGAGTERIEEDLRAALPGARIGRLDRDTSRGRRLTSLLDSFRKRKLDVLVGTQMVAKGHDFPAVTLAGVLFADHGLRFPEFRAAERTFQLVTQVAGRAGRAERPGRVLVQTYSPDHYALIHAARHDYLSFAAEELRYRQSRGYPPFTFIAMIRVEGKEDAAAESAGLAAAGHLVSASGGDSVTGRGGAVSVFGPAPAPIPRLRGQYRYQVMAKCRSRSTLHSALESLRAEIAKNPPHGARVAIDVDPVSLL